MCSIPGASVRLHISPAAQGQKPQWGQFWEKIWKVFSVNSRPCVHWSEKGEPEKYPGAAAVLGKLLLLMLYLQQNHCHHWPWGMRPWEYVWRTRILQLTSLPSAWLWCQLARKGLVKDGKEAMTLLIPKGKTCWSWHLALGTRTRQDSSLV